MSVIEVNDTNYIGQVQNSDLPVLLDFYATWCGPCQRLGPVVEELAEETQGRFRICRTDVDQAPNLVRQFRIMSVPTLLYMRRGQVVSKSIGLISPAELENNLAKAKA